MRCHIHLLLLLLVFQNIVARIIRKKIASGLPRFRVSTPENRIMRRKSLSLADIQDKDIFEFAPGEYSPKPQFYPPSIFPPFLSSFLPSFVPSSSFPPPDIFPDNRRVTYPLIARNLVSSVSDWFQSMIQRILPTKSFVLL
ncbi:uncharacterized protein LOC111694728 [Eurytemora carolleeae]|uniref:uncharacterized protein LOC111694728 n=1 Tax=Eurytemora carolleeae TaxID=1294199 RepID=UPI000C77751F|nr:uncharacterized protein LOC111694728 [Eurytemora carolleeae]|eukprot:XP_023319492.1 uncharacterized protein LOC111694728 [Eurytemora affinis]